MSFISISIDLSGSTAAKQALVEASSNIEKYRKTYYNQYVTLLYQMERAFYLNFLDSKYLDFSKLYLIKIIGDEFWYAYEIDPEDKKMLNGVTQDIVDALMKLFAEERFLTFKPIRQESDFCSATKNSPKTIQFDLPIKAYVDLITDAIDVNVGRYAFLKDIISRVNGRNSTVFSMDQEYIELCDRLILDARNFNTQKNRIASRTDYIGFEIDRFFRAASHCKPKLVGIGDSLMKELSVQLQSVASYIDQISIKVLSFKNSDGKNLSWRKYAVSESIPSVMMKGVNENYIIHHLFSGDCLGEAIYAPSPEVATLMEPTRSFLAQCGFYAIDRKDMIA